MTAAAPTAHTPAQLAVTVGALGVVFGDIGTSPIYTISTIFKPDDPHPVAATMHSVYGLISLVVWSVTIIVTLKYVLLVMRADNDGEGGILALITLIRRHASTGSRRSGLVADVRRGLPDRPFRDRVLRLGRRRPCDHRG